MLHATPAIAGSPAKRPAPQMQAALEHAAEAGTEVVMRALALVGVPYRWGGKAPATGLDCSGLVHHVFGEIGLRTPLNTTGLSRSGTTIARQRDLQPGDLVFFNTLRRAFSHVGIYLGDGRFVHAPSTGARVRVESLNVAYWRQRYNGARRLAPAGLPPATRLAQAAPAAAATADPREAPALPLIATTAEAPRPATTDTTHEAARTTSRTQQDLERIASFYQY